LQPSCRQDESAQRRRPFAADVRQDGKDVVGDVAGEACATDECGDEGWAKQRLVETLAFEKVEGPLVCPKMVAAADDS
jgi:hypothetical protein